MLGKFPVPHDRGSSHGQSRGIRLVMNRAGVSGKAWTEQGYQVSHGQSRGIR